MHSPLNGLVSPNCLVIRSSACTTDSTEPGSETNRTRADAAGTREELGGTDALESPVGFLPPGGICFLVPKFQVQIMKLWMNLFVSDTG